MRNKKAVVLLSGGLDSAVTLFLAKESGFKCLCLAFDYGQRHKREIKSAKAVAKAAGCPLQVVKISLPWKGSTLFAASSRAPALAAGKKGIPATYVPARNIIFLSFALSYAEAAGASAIFIGAHSQDYSGYPDCRMQFIRAFRKVVSCGTKAGTEKKAIAVLAPLINKNKAQIIRQGMRLGAPLGLTWSCYRGGRSPCGKCDSCYFRQKGFKQAGIKDPL